MANPPETDPLPPPSRASRLLGETVFLPQSAFCRSVSPVLRLCSRAKHRRVPAGAACKSPPTREFCLFARVFAGLVVCTTPLFALPFAKDDKVGVKSVFLPFLFLLPPHTHIFPLNLPHQCSAVPRLRQMSRISTVVVQTNRHKKSVESCFVVPTARAVLSRYRFASGCFPGSLQHVVFACMESAWSNLRAAVWLYVGKPKCFGRGCALFEVVPVCYIGACIFSLFFFRCCFRVFFFL